MTTDEAKMEICRKLVSVYGPAEGLRCAGVVGPAILKDFADAVRRRKDGGSVTEEYNTDDGRASLVLTGRYAKHKVVIDSVE